MEFFKVKFYDSDGGGMRTELSKTIDFQGTFEEVVNMIETTKSPWGMMYQVHNEARHGCAVIKQVTSAIVGTENEINALQIKLNELYEELR
jgi:hypothetical protein